MANRKMSSDQFARYLLYMKKGESVYINAINLTITQINILKQFLSRGALQPDLEELTMMIKPEHHAEFFSGEKVAPQMTYIKC